MEENVEEIGPTDMELLILHNQLALSNHLYIFCVLDYIISNNCINEYITHEFDFKDDEIVDFYISFLKSMALRIESIPLELFYNQVRFNRIKNIIPFELQSARFKIRNI